MAEVEIPLGSLFTRLLLALKLATLRIGPGRKSCFLGESRGFGVNWRGKKSVQDADLLEIGKAVTR